jgi:beta-N-acetylhexosaminidase
VVDVIAAIRAGVDLLLAAPDPEKLERIDGALRHAASRRLFQPAELRASADRLAALRRRLAAAPRPGLEVVGSAAHAALAREVAERSLTLVRDRDGLLPLRPAPGDAILAVMPRPVELTPADTSASVAPGLAAAVRGRWPAVREIVVSQPPTDAEIAGVVAAARDAAVVVAGTIVAPDDPAQVRLVDALVATGRPLVTVSLRTPWDATAYPAAGTHVAAYGILPPTLEALTRALFGDIPFPGRLPVRVAGVEALVA